MSLIKKRYEAIMRQFKEDVCRDPNTDLLLIFEKEGDRYDRRTKAGRTK